MDALKRTDEDRYRCLQIEEHEDELVRGQDGQQVFYSQTGPRYEICRVNTIEYKQIIITDKKLLYNIDIHFLYVHL